MRRESRSPLPPLSLLPSFSRLARFLFIFPPFSLFSLFFVHVSLSLSLPPFTSLCGPMNFNSIIVASFVPFDYPGIIQCENVLIRVIAERRHKCCLFSLQSTIVYINANAKCGIISERFRRRS